MFLLASSALKDRKKLPCGSFSGTRIPEVWKQRTVTSYPPPVKGLKPSPRPRCREASCLKNKLFCLSIHILFLYCSLSFSNEVLWHPDFLVSLGLLQKYFLLYVFLTYKYESKMTNQKIICNTWNNKGLSRLHRKENVQMTSPCMKRCSALQIIKDWPRQETQFYTQSYFKSLMINEALHYHLKTCSCYNSLEGNLVSSITM